MIKLGSSSSSPPVGPATVASSRRLCNQGSKTDVFRAAVALLTATVTAVTLSQAGAAPHDTVVIQGLDKVTARVSTIEALVGQTFRLGTLEIIARHCEKRPPEEMPEVISNRTPSYETEEGISVSWRSRDSMETRTISSGLRPRTGEQTV